MSYYLMHRGWMDHHLFKDQPYSEREAWEYLIASANYTSSKFRQGNNLYDIMRGQIATSYRALAAKWKWSVNKSIRFLKLLILDGMISVKTEHNFLLINITNYESYQDFTLIDGTRTEHGRNTDGTAVETETNTNQKKIKQIKTINEVIGGETSVSPPPPPKEKSRGTRLSRDWDLPEAWGEWAEQQGLTFKQVIAECDKFKDFWIAKTGPNATKVDWEATWRNWIRKSMEGFGK